MIKGKYYSSKTQEYNYSIEMKQCIENTCQYCIDTAYITNGKSNEEKTNYPIMMLGKIQSGKTRAFTGLMALAFDNEFDMVFILTKNSKALVQQTYKRMRREFREFIYDNEIDVFDIMKVESGLSDYELDKKIIIVAKKEKQNLHRISTFISDYAIQQRKNCLVIDDEADTTGIGFSKVKGTEDEFDLRTVASKVNEIRGSLDGCVFVQVTATPYALYLQPEFNNNEIEPIKPKKTVLVPSGEGYIGGEYYFLKSREDEHPAQYIFQAVSDYENELVSDQKRKGKKSKIEDRRSFKNEEVLISREKLKIFKKGLMNFIVGGCVLRHSNPKSHYAYIIHTAIQKSSHLQLENIAAEFFKQIKQRTSATETIISDMLQEAYCDISKSVNAYGFAMPEFKSIEEAFFHAVDRGHIKITTVNSDKDMDAILDEDNGELKLSAPFSIFVGGQVLDRGITIPRLIGFYYGRNPKAMQQDTVLQHSRMFGYRSQELLSVTRFYTTERIYDNMTRITEFDNSLREDIENATFEEGIYFIQQYVAHTTDFNGDRIEDKVIPCSPSKIALSSIVFLKPGIRLLPIGFTPVEKMESKKLSRTINEKVSSLVGENEKEPVLISIDDAKILMHLVFSGIIEDKNSGRFISEDRFISTMSYLTTNTKTLYLIVRKNRNVSKYKKNGTVYSDSPDTSKDELSLAQKIAIDKPVLMVLHQKGDLSNGWNGNEFWWPVLFMPQNTKRTILALPKAEGLLRTRK